MAGIIGLIYECTDLTEQPLLSKELKFERIFFFQFARSNEKIKLFVE